MQRLPLIVMAVICLLSPVLHAEDHKKSNAAQLTASLKAWEKAKDKCDGNYSYQVRRSSFIGTQWTTTIVVRDNKVTERRFEVFEGRRGPVKPGEAPPRNELKWVETGEQIGKHKEAATARTMDEIYAEAKKVLAKKLAPHEKLYIRFDDRGLLKYCFYMDTRIADDAPMHGVSIANLKLESKNKPLQPIAAVKGIQPKRDAFIAHPRKGPTVIRSAEDAAKTFDEAAVKKLTGQVDFKQQVLLVFAWRGSGQDRLTYNVMESFPEQVRFNYQPGRTKDLRPHVYIFALRANVKWR